MQARRNAFTPASVRLSGTHHLGTLVLDSKGVIRSCSEAIAHLAGVHHDAIVGQGVRCLIPDLPIQPATEGYNIAYARFSSARHRRQSWSLKKNNGGTLHVCGHFVIVKMQAQFELHLDLHDPAGEIQAPAAFERTAVILCAASPDSISLRQTACNEAPSGWGTTPRRSIGRTRQAAASH